MSTVRVIAESVSTLTGFAVVGIAAVTDGDHLEVLAHVGPPSGPWSAVGGHSRLSTWATKLESAEDWGDLMLWSTSGSTSDVTRHNGTIDVETWSSEDRLVAPLHSSEGDFVGFLWVGGAKEGLRPDAARQQVLEDFAHLAGRAVAVAVVHQDMDEKVRLITAARAVVRRAARELEIDALMEQVCRPLVAGFRARGMWLHVFASESRHSRLYDQSERMPLLPPESEALARRIAENAWAEKRIGIVSRSRLRGGLLTPAEVRGVRDFLEANALGSLLFIPMGSGPECLGSLILARDLDESLWSEGEIEVALDLGHDLGRAILNATSFQRERDLVHRLQALDAHKTTLMRTMSHELKNPLAAIRGNLEMLDEVAHGHPDAERSLLGATRGTQRMSRLIDDLLSLAEAGDPDRPLEVMDVDLGALVVETAEVTRSEALGSGVVIRVEAPAGPLLVLGNPLELELVVTNLLSNAVKYSPDGGTVTLELARSADQVVLTCTDEGLGMSEEDSVRIFEEFFRSSQARARAQPGTGLGLSIVDHIVRRHHGTIQVTSALGAGSTFRVALPALLDPR